MDDRLMVMRPGLRTPGPMLLMQVGSRSARPPGSICVRSGDSWRLRTLRPKIQEESGERKQAGATRLFNRKTERARRGQDCPRYGSRALEVLQYWSDSRTGNFFSRSTSFALDAAPHEKSRSNSGSRRLLRICSRK